MPPSRTPHAEPTSLPPNMDRAREDYLSYLRYERRLSDHTVDAYAGDLAQYLGWLARSGQGSPEQARTEDVERYLTREGERGLSARTLARRLSTLRGFHAYLRRRRQTLADPTEGLEPPRRGRRLPRVLSVEETRGLVESPTGDDPLARRDRAALELMYGSGLRVSEVLNLPPEALRLREAYVRVVGKGDKERAVPLTGVCIRALKDYLEHGRPELVARRDPGVVFVNRRGGRLSRMGLWRILRRHADHAGLAADFHPHMLRHSFATHLLEGGAELLGHASVTTTEIYTHVDRGLLREVHRLFHPRSRTGRRGGAGAGRPAQGLEKETL
jgi:integrase/recombinase XerD